MTGFGAAEVDGAGTLDDEVAAAVVVGAAFVVDELAEALLSVEAGVSVVVVSAFASSSYSAP